MARSASKQSHGAGTRFGQGDGPASAAAQALRIGELLDGKYRIEGLLGEGGMGAVWWAHHVQLDRPVAIKILRPGPDRSTLSERLRIEARAAARLVHPAIVRVFDTDTSESGEPYIVMELLQGESLAALLDRGRLAGVHAVQLLLPIAEGLSLAHAQGVVHRDLKPHNVFLAEEGERLQPKLLDFGIAKLAVAPGPAGSLTETGITVGSPDYMSPEQARGMKDIDYRADVWALAVVLYEAVTGFVPFDGDNYNALMRAIVENEPRAIPLEDGVDAALADLIHWGLTKEREQRPQTVHELGRELARWLIERGVHEDVCGTPLGPRWITRVSQKSVPVIEEPRAPTAAPPPVVRGDTLVSPRLPLALAPEQVPVETPPPARVRRRPAWMVAALGALSAIAAGSAWILKPASGGSVAPTVSVVAVPASSPVAPPASAPPVVERSEPAVSVVQIASSAPSPSLAPSSNGHSAPVGSATLKSRDGKPPSEIKPVPVKPASDAHDETRELLQAY
jgi:serine/threonine-protein kinase